MAFNLKLPTVGQIVGVAISMAIVFFVAKMMPDKVKAFFQV
jgi:hypothetical protein